MLLILKLLARDEIFASHSYKLSGDKLVCGPECEHPMTICRRLVYNGSVRTTCKKRGQFDFTIGNCAKNRPEFKAARFPNPDKGLNAVDYLLSETRRAAPSLCGGGVNSRAIVLKTKLSFLKPGEGTVPIFCEHLSPGDESACHPKPRYLRSVERNPCDAGATIWRTTGGRLSS